MQALANHKWLEVLEIFVMGYRHHRICQRGLLGGFYIFLINAFEVAGIGVYGWPASFSVLGILKLKRFIGR